MGVTTRELQEHRRETVTERRALWRERLSRRTVVKGSSLLALGSSSSIAAFLAACGGSSKTGGAKSAATAYNPIITTPAAGSTGTAAAAPTFKDTTITPPYKQGLPDDQAKIDPLWQQFPYVYKYNWRRQNWNAPLTTGGHYITTTAPPSNYDLMKTANGVPGSLYYQSLWHTAIHAGLNLDGSSIEPDLAKTTDHSPDYTTWTFTLTPGTKFHDIPPVSGRELVADDVVFSFQRYLDTSIWGTGLQYVDKVSAPDKYTVRFDMKQPQVSFDAIVSLPYYGIFAQEHFQNQDLFKSQPIGTGAFMNKESVYQDHATAVRNPNFLGRPFWMDAKYQQTPIPFMDQMTLQYFSSDAAARAAFVAGQADDYAITYLDPAVLKDVLTAKPDLNVTVNALWATFPVMLFWNYKNPLFQDVRIRRALSMGIDREAIMQQVFSGAGVPGGGPVAFDMLGQQLPPPLKDYGPYYQFDPKTALQLLAAAGHPDGLTLQWECSSTLQQVIQFQVYKAVQQAWKQNIKVDVQFNFVDALTATNDGLNHAFQDLLQQSTAIGYDPYSLAYPVLHSKGGVNLGQANDSTLDDLLNQLGAATSPAQRLDLTKQVVARAQDQVTYMYVGWPQACTTVQPWVHGDTNNLYVYLFYYGINNYRNVWIDQTAPNGRGGKAV